MMMDDRQMTNAPGSQQWASDTTGTQFMEGTDVYDVNGDKVGSVSEHGVQNNCLVVHHGIFREDVYIPLGVISRNDLDGVYLTVTKDQALNQDWGLQAAGGMTATDMATETTMAQDIRVPVMEEELVVGTQQQEKGRVHLHKDVVEEQQTVEAPVMQERVTVERVPVQGEAADIGPDAFVEKDIDVPVMGEELVVGKRQVVAEEVRLRKEVITDQQQVSDTVRKERVIVEGADSVTGADTVTDVNLNKGYDVKGSDVLVDADTTPSTTNVNINQ